MFRKRVSACGPHRAAFFIAGAMGAALLAIASVAMLNSPARAFDAKCDPACAPLWDSRHGMVLLQDEGAKPFMCRTRARMIDLILRKVPEATIERHRLGNGTMWLLVDHGNQTGGLYALNSDGLVCESYPLKKVAFLSIRTLVEAKDRKFEVLAVWPEP